MSPAERCTLPGNELTRDLSSTGIEGDKDR